MIPESGYTRTASRVRAALSSISARPITMRVEPPMLVLRFEAALTVTHAFERPIDMTDLDGLNELGLRGVLQQTMDQADRVLIRRLMQDIRISGKRLHLTLGDLLGDYAL